MINTADMCVNRIVLFEREKVLRSRKLFNAFDIVPWLFGPFLVYLGLQWGIAMLQFAPYKNAILTLVTYVLLLILCTISVCCKRKKAKRKGQVFILTGKEIESVFLSLLLLCSVFFFVVGNNETQADTKFFGAVSLTLYVGFTLSPKSLFSVKNLKHFINCFVVPLSNIFKTVHYMFFTLCVVIFGVICYFQDSPLVLCNLMIYLFGVLLLFCFSLAPVRNSAKASFLKNIEGLIDGKRILILQLGPDYIVGKALKQLLQKNNIEVVNSSEYALTGNRYQIVIVLNSLRKKKEYLPKIDLIDSYLTSDGCVIDPFITRNHRRAFIDAWFGVPRRNPELFTYKQYKSIMCGNRRSFRNTRRYPWIPVLAVTGIVLVLVPAATYLVALLFQSTQLIPQIGSVDSWIAFAGSILGGSLTMLALVFTLHHERKIAEKAELQKIRPLLFCSINKEQFTRDGFEIRMPNCTNDYDFIRWRINNVSENVANHIRIVDERTFIKDQEELHEIDSDTLLDDHGISIMTVSMQDYIALEPHGVAQNRTNFSLETDEQGEYKINSAFDFLNAITIEYSDIKGIGAYRSKFTFHININIDNKNNPHVFIESVETTLLGE